MANVTIYYKNPNTGVVTTNSVSQNDYDTYWQYQGWTTTPPVSSDTIPAPVPAPVPAPAPSPAPIPPSSGGPSGSILPPPTSQPSSGQYNIVEVTGAVRKGTWQEAVANMNSLLQFGMNHSQFQGRDVFLSVAQQGQELGLQVPQLKSGLNSQQSTSIVNLLWNKPAGSWNDADRSNWNYATNNTPFPTNNQTISQLQSPQSGTPPVSPDTIPAPTGTKRLVYVWNSAAKPARYDIYKVDANGTVKHMSTQADIATAVSQGYVDPKRPEIEGQSSPNLPPGLTPGMGNDNQPGDTTGDGTGDQAGDQTEQTDENGNPIGNGVPFITSTSEPIYVQFSSDPNGAAEGDASTIWLYFPDKKKYIPFTSMEAFTKFTKGATPEQLKISGDLHVLNPTEILHSSQWGAGVPINLLFAAPKDGYQSNGLLPDGTTGMEQTKANYGATENADKYKKAAFMVDGLITILKDPKNISSISQATIDRILNDPSILQKYAKALAYGGYSPSDVLRDINRLSLVDGGNTSLANLNIISEALNKKDYVASGQYGQIAGNPLLTVPTINGLDMSALDLPITNMPEEISNILVPPLPDPTTPEFRDMMDDIEAAYYDVIDMQIGAQTENQKRLAEVEWTKFKEDIQKKYGIMLSNNATEAWNQIQGLGENYGQRGLTNSGFQNEAVDNYLQGVRKQDAQTRDSKMTEQEQTTMEYYQKYASSEEIAKLVASDYTRASQWGLVPSAQVKEQFSLANLRSKFPGTPDYLLQRYALTILDDNGNYRSQLFQNSYSNKMSNLDAKESYQTEKVISNKETEEEKAYAPYEISGEAFSSYTPSTYTSAGATTGNPTTSTPVPTGPVNPNGTSALTNPGQYTVPVTPPTTPSSSYGKYYYYNGDSTKQKIKIVSAADEANIKKAYPDWTIYEGSF